MIKIMLYSKEQKSIWNAFNADSKNGIFLFNRDFMDYHADRFKDNSLMFYDENKLIALLPCNICENILYSHQGLTFGGFIVHKNMRQTQMLECFQSLHEYMQENKILKIIYKAIPYIYHKKPTQEDLYALFYNNASISRIDCSTTIDLENPFTFTKGRKAQISRAKRENVIIEQSHNFHSFITLLNHVLQTRHHAKAVHNAEELSKLAMAFPHNIHLWIAKKDDCMIAATLLFIHENIVHTQYLASSEKGREVGALDLLIKTLMERFREDKKYFDFGISTENEGKILNLGLIAQKESFGGSSIIHTFYELSNYELFDTFTTGGGANLSLFWNLCHFSFIFSSFFIYSNNHSFLYNQYKILSLQHNAKQKASA